MENDPSHALCCLKTLTTSLSLESYSLKLTLIGFTSLWACTTCQIYICNDIVENIDCDVIHTLIKVFGWCDIVGFLDA